MIVRRVFFLVIAIVVIGGGGALSASADGGKKFEDCEQISPKPSNCSMSWALSAEADAHSCEWSGLTLKCKDKMIQLCTYKKSENTTDTCWWSTTPVREIPGIFQVEDAITQFVRLSQWGLGFVVILAVLMFIWAGWQFLTAGGREGNISEGKRIIGGTITGLIISFSAYVIINFAVFALTGKAINSTDKFAGPLGVVFPGLKEQKPFAGDSGTVETRTNCRSTNNENWDKGCSDRIYCADTGTGNTGNVATLQKRLNELGCGCGEPDGCYGPKTLDCVRHFQATNRLPLTGEVDAQTAARLSSGAVACNNPIVPEGRLVMGALPNATYPPSGKSPDNLGTCLIRNGTSDLYCAGNVRETSCFAMGNDNFFYKDFSPDSALLRSVCGFCQTTATAATNPASFNCFQYATKNWCENISSDLIFGYKDIGFTPGSCKNACRNNGACVDTLLIHPQ